VIHPPDLDDTPRFDGGELAVRVPSAEPAAHTGAAFDAVPAALEVDPALEAPWLRVTAVHDVASGELSLPGRVGRCRGTARVRRGCRRAGGDRTNEP
jgi:hypothetical protein